MPGRLSHDPDDQFRQNRLLVAMSAQELAIGIAARQKGFFEMLQAEPGRVGGGESDPVGVERTVLLAGEVGGVLGAELAQLGGKELRLGRGLELVTLHEVLGHKEIPDSRHDGRQQDPDGVLPLAEELG